MVNAGGAAGEGGEAGEGGGAGEANEGGEAGESVTACMMGDFDLSSAQVSVNPDSSSAPAWSLRVADADETSYLSIESWRDFDGPTEAGTFDLGGINYADCGLCVLVYADCNGDDCDTIYYAQEGVVDIQSIDLSEGGEVTVNFTGVVLTEVTINENFVSTPEPDARTICDEGEYSAISAGAPPPLTDGVGEQLPEFSGTDQNGDEFLSASLMGSMAVIAVNAGDWCPPCGQFAEESESTLQALTEADDRYDVRMLQVMISGDTNDSDADQATVTAWAETHGITSYPVIYGDDDLVEGNLANLFALLEPRIEQGQFGVPNYWVVDPLGQIRFYGGGWAFPDMDRSEEDPVAFILETVNTNFETFLSENPDWVSGSNSNGETEDTTDGDSDASSEDNSNSDADTDSGAGDSSDDDAGDSTDNNSGAGDSSDDDAGDNTPGDDSGAGDNTPGDDSGDNTPGDDSGDGDNTSGDNSGAGDSSNDGDGDNTPGDDSGDNTPGDDSGDGDNTPGDNSGAGDSSNDGDGDNTPGDDSGDNTPGDDSGDGDNTPGDNSGAGDSSNDGDGDNTPPADNPNPDSPTDDDSGDNTPPDDDSGENTPPGDDSGDNTPPNDNPNPDIPPRDDSSGNGNTPPDDDPGENTPSNGDSGSDAPPSDGSGAGAPNGNENPR